MMNLDAVRKRPGMYIGALDDGTGLSNMVFEAVCNAFNEALAGHADKIDVRLNADGSCIVRDNGRGIPTDIYKPAGVSKAELILTELHAGGKFDGERYDVPGRLHGVGLAVINALSDRLELRTMRDGHEFTMAFRGGHMETPLTRLAPTDERGTELTFLPSAAVFPTTRFDFDALVHRLTDLASLNAGLTFLLTDERQSERREVRLNQSDCHDR